MTTNPSLSGGAAEQAAQVAGILYAAADEAEQWLTAGTPDYQPALPPDEIRATARRIGETGGSVTIAWEERLP